MTQSLSNRPFEPTAERSPLPTVLGVAGALVLIVVAGSFWHQGDLVSAGALGGIGLVVLLAAVWRLAWGSISANGSVARLTSLLALATEVNPDGRMIVDRRGRVLYANASYRQIMGLPGKAPLVDPMTQLADAPEATDRLRRVQVGAMSGGRAYEELEVQLADGSRKWMAFTARSLTGASGGPVLWYVEDATARHEIQEAIRAEQGKLTDFIDNAPVGFYSADHEGRFQFVNATLAEWLGLTATDLTVGSLRLADVIQFDAAGGSTERPQQDEGWLIARDGGRRPVRITQSVVRGADGAEMRTRSVVHDLTQELAWQDALQQAERHFRDFFAFAPVGIVVLDDGDRVREINPAFRAMLGGGQGSDSGIGGNFLAMVHEEDRAEAYQRLEAVRGGASGAAPIEVRLSGPAERVAQLYVSRLQADGSGTYGLLLHLIDTTEQKSLELQFAQSQKMQAVGQLAGGVAHDFNNLLTAMIGFCDLLLLRHQAGDQSFADIMQIKQNANRAANLVRQLLAFSRQQTLRPKVLVVTDVLVELSNLLRRLIGETIELKMVHGRDLGLVKVDQGQFEQVIINLAVNARDAMVDGGTLTVRTANVTAEESTKLGHELMPAGEYVLIEAIDTGKGIPKENVGKIFEPFFTTKPVGAGTGLGLSTVYGIVKQTGGFIYPFSAPGQGATFKIYLPRFRATGSLVEAEQPERREARDLTGKGTVLLVEDEDAVRIFAARALRNKGYNVLEANSGEAALAQVTEHQGAIDVLISDVVMPNMDGPTLAKRVRATWPDMKIIFISGYAEDAFRRNLDRGAEINFLPKPFSLKQLAGKVKEVLGHPEP